MSVNKSKCGYIAIVGRPNVGKSTLLNCLLKQKISITSDKPQTTRQRILGIKTEDNVQAIYVDTPGIHKKAKRALNRYMNRAAASMLFDVDVIIFMVDARVWTDEDELVLKKLRSTERPVILALNKVDLIKEKKKLLPTLQKVSEKMNFIEIIPLSVLKETNVQKLEAIALKFLPEAAYFFSDEAITDRDDKFLISEIVREKIMRVTGQEVPYDTTVMVETFKYKEKVLHLDVVIWVERRGQKIIIVGSKGEKMKEIGKKARLDIEKLFNCKVFLTLWVKIKEGWSDNEKTLIRLGYD